MSQLTIYILPSSKNRLCKAVGIREAGGGGGCINLHEKVIDSGLGLPRPGS